MEGLEDRCRRQRGSTDDDVTRETTKQRQVRLGENMTDKDMRLPM